MSDCLETNSLLTIAEALDWQTSAKLNHLQTCANCRAALDMLQRLREELHADDVVPPAVIQQTQMALQQAAGRTHMWTVLEPGIAGLTAVLILRSSGIQVDSPLVAAVGFVMGAALAIAAAIWGSESSASGGAAIDG